MTIMASEDSARLRGHLMKGQENEKDVEQHTTNRDTWSGKFEFLLSCVGLAVGLGNIWRFPYLCYKNGGGAFLVSYFTVLLTCAAPLFLLETGLGQYMSQGGVGVWDICPIFKGVGICATVILGLGNAYYNVISAWAMYYLGMSFTTVLPWAHCNNNWNTHRCRGYESDVDHNSSVRIEYMNGTDSSEQSMNVSLNASSSEPAVDPAIEFWEYKVLQRSSGIEEVGGLVWPLAVCLFVSWTVIYISVWKGIKVTGKLVYFTSTFPYVMLFILLVRGLTLEGAITGIAYYVNPQFHKLLYPQVWIDAGTQVLFSYALGLNCQVTLGSYNKFNNKYLRDSILVMTINTCTSIAAGFAVFSVLGFMAKQGSTSVDKVVEYGPGLVFIAMPKAVSEMSGGPVFAVLFFIMILMVAFSTLMVGVQSIATIICDEFPRIQRHYGREIVSAVFCVLCFFTGLTMVTQGGVYVFQLFDHYACSGMAMLWVCFFQCVAVAWVFGISRFSDCVAMMTGTPLNALSRFSLVFVAPSVLAILYVWLWSQFSLLTYGGVYVYPAWAQVFGLFIAFSSMMCVPIYFFYKLLTSRGNSLREKWYIATMPILRTERIPDSWPEKQFLVGKISQNAVNRADSYSLLQLQNDKKQDVYA